MEEPNDRIGTELLFENERLRVWDMTLEPGQATDLHRHDNDYLFVYVTDDNRLDIEMPSGDVIHAESPDGAVAYWEVGAADPPPHYTHRARNVGDRAHRQILVEFLGPSASEEPRGPITNDR